MARGGAVTMKITRTHPSLPARLGGLARGRSPRPADNASQPPQGDWFRASRSSGGFASVAGPVTKFMLSGLVALVIVGVGEGYFLHRETVDQAVENARNVTEVVGNGLVEPAITQAVIDGDPEAIAGLDALVRERLIKDPIVRVKIWTADGRIVYSDEPRLIGQVYPLPEDDLEALHSGRVAADLSDLSKVENRYEREHKRLLQVYMGMTSQGGEPVLFEAYLKASTVDASGTDIWLSFIPAILVGLLALELIQVPLAWSMARRLWRSQRDRMVLFRRAIEASDIERRRVAGVIHDGVVQKLTGLSYSLQAKADRLAPSGQAEAAGALEQAAADTRANVRELRAALVDLYPPDLERAGLAAVLSDLFAPLTAAGIETRLDIPPDLAFSTEIEALLFRASRETLANVLKHSGATAVDERITIEDDRVVMVVEDNGKGFSSAEVEARQREGHFGLRLLADLVAHAGGALQVQSQPGAGARVRLEVPLR
jgi:signal transduction histidine kinase